jgi:hypothetical protein
MFAQLGVITPNLTPKKGRSQIKVEINFSLTIQHESSLEHKAHSKVHRGKCARAKNNHECGERYVQRNKSLKLEMLVEIANERLERHKLS